MEKYSHGPFEVSGYIYHIANPASEIDTIMGAWKQWKSENMGDHIEHRAYHSLHAIYYNYKNGDDTANRSYDMLIGFITEDGKIQASNDVITLKIPAQDYRYTTIEGWTPEKIEACWKNIGETPKTELQRTYGYDLEMYSEDMKDVTIAVSMKE